MDCTACTCQLCWAVQSRERRKSIPITFEMEHMICFFDWWNARMWQFHFFTSSRVTPLEFIVAHSMEIFSINTPMLNLFSFTSSVTQSQASYVCYPYWYWQCTLRCSFTWHIPLTKGKTSRTFQQGKEWLTFFIKYLFLLCLRLVFRSSTRTQRNTSTNSDNVLHVKEREEDYMQQFWMCTYSDVLHRRALSAGWAPSQISRNRITSTMALSVNAAKH